jgi:hypothetical protein
MTDFEGRAVTHAGSSLKISGAAARVIVRWRFAAVGRATVNGRTAAIQNDDNGAYIEFDHTAETTVLWH